MFSSGAGLLYIRLQWACMLHAANGAKMPLVQVHGSTFNYVPYTENNVFVRLIAALQLMRLGNQ
jgi:hypothetical protein